MQLSQIFIIVFDNLFNKSEDICIYLLQYISFFLKKSFIMKKYVCVIHHEAIIHYSVHVHKNIY